jgi:cyclomaltodextrinase
MKHALFTLAAVAVLSCTNKENTDKPTAEIVGLCSPIKLQHEQTTIYLQDYFLNPEAIDSFHLPVELRWKYNAKDSTRLIATGNLNRAFGLFTAYSNGSAFNIPIKRSTRLGYSFAFDPGNARYQRVQIRGSFNAWNQHADTFYVEDGIYKTDLILQPGTYEYLLVLDGEEQVDPTNPEKVSNGQGGYNSVLRLADASPDPNQVKTLRVNDTGFALYLNGYSRDAQDLITLWQNEVMLPTEANGDTIFYTIPKAASSLDRSFIRAFTGNETKFGNDLLIPLQNGRVITNTASLTRNDWEAASLYFLMIDRFKNGNTANDSTVHDSLIHPRANYYGGDIAGVTQAIEAGYFDSLGMNTVWISPVTQNPWDAWGYWDKGGVTTKFSGYHGYWPISNVQPERRFASEAELRNFLDVAHADNKNVLLDYVANHVHQDHPIYQNNSDWATNLYLPDSTLNTERWDDHRLTTWFDTFLPTLDLRRPEIVEPMTDSALVWITDYDFDGFRHDATKHIDELYWRELTKKTKEQVAKPQNRRIYQIGETYGSPELIASYISSGMLDAQFDFNLYDAQVAALVDENGSYQRVADVLNGSLEWYGHHHLMGNISGNQDRGRFISYASGDVRLSEDAKLAGWTRDIGKPRAEAYNRLALLHAFNFAVPGIPVIYYGDEYGMPGANDPDNRRMMQFDGLDTNEQKLKSTLQELIALRNSNMALLYGSTEITVVNDDVLVIHRQYFDEHVWFFLNKGAEEAMIPMELVQQTGVESTIETGVGGLYSVMTIDKLYFGIHPNSFGILKSEKKE